MARDNSQILKNSFYVYGRLFFTMFITLYTSRIVLSELGVEGYGTYNIVAGITIMFSSIKSMFASALQRYYNFEIGRGHNIERLNLVFNIGLKIHSVGAFILFLILEIIGTWLISCQLEIPEQNLSTAHLIFQFTIISTLLSMLSVPYDALVIAREKMGFYAIISIIDAVLKLGFALSLSLLNSNKLFYYGLFMLSISILNFVILLFYSYKNFKETIKFSSQKDQTLMKEMVGFAGWNFFGNISFSLTNEVSNLFLNLFGGVTANAARGITYQVRGAVSSLLSNALIAVRPQATQEYAAGNYVSFFNIIYFASKTVFFISFITIIPLLLYTNEILNLWLGQIPEYCVDFTRIMLLQLLIRSFHEPIDLVFKSTGHLKYYQLISFTISLIGLPIIYVILKMGYSVLCVFIGMCFMEVIEFMSILILSKQEGLSIKKYFIKSLFPVIVVCILSALTCMFMHLYIDLNIFISFFVLISLILLYVLFFGFNHRERVMIIEMVKKIIK